MVWVASIGTEADPAIREVCGADAITGAAIVTAGAAIVWKPPIGAEMDPAYVAAAPEYTG